ncbi:TolC family protein [Gelidibacter salicanalis]|uniref:TolC family protein n=1 Tax=Gelidibacter salicanalis TaxID=291193 RepID=A0A934NGP8_9FLAO|nr:TolC family protein [Gelidibacter salicanalis]MBJ7879841.1 TolC family protein [Gelidibacter salicanalis]
MTFKLSMALYFIATLVLFGQTEQRIAMTLEECISLAIENNLDLKSTKLTKETWDVNFNQNKNALLPRVNGSYNLGIANGRSIDPFTNGIVNQELTFSNAALGLDFVAFNGFRLINRWKQAKLNLRSAEMEVEAAKQSVILNVTLTYLQVLNAQDLVKLAESRLTTTQGQLDRLRSLYEEETGNPAEYHDLQGQLALDASNSVERKNNLEIELINLNTLTNTETSITAVPLNTELEFEVYDYTAQEIYEQALQVFPTIKARDLSLEAAEKAIAVARSQYVPEISLFANLNTNYSSAAKLFNETGTGIAETGDFVTINNQDYSVFAQETNFTSENIPYRDQFDNNLNSSIGVSVSVPIFNGFRAKNNVALEKIKKEEAQTALAQIKLDLKQSIKRSYSAMATAFERYKLLQDQVDAYKESFRINEIRFNNGVSNSVDYIISKNNFDNAQTNLANVKYEYALRVKILEYYRGNI